MNKTEITDILPQKYPMVMIDEHVFSDEIRTISKMNITADNIFCDNGYFTEPGLIENIAQTAALRIWYLSNKNSNPGEDPKMGYIGGIKKFELHFLPLVGQTIQAEIEIQREIMDFLLVDGHVTCENELVANCEMKIFQSKL